MVANGLEDNKVSHDDTGNGCALFEIRIEFIVGLVTDEQPRPGSTLFISDDHSSAISTGLLEKRSLSVVPEHFTAGELNGHMISL